MALTTPQRVALHQILEIPLMPSAYRLTDQDNLTVMRRSQSESAFQANAQLTSYLASLSSEEEDVLVTLLNRWISIGTVTVELVGGSAGAVGGLNMRPIDERAEIMRQVKAIVPFWRYHEEIERDKSAGGGSNSIPFIR